MLLKELCTLLHLTIPLDIERLKLHNAKAFRSHENTSSFEDEDDSDDTSDDDISMDVDDMEKSPLMV